MPPLVKLLAILGLTGAVGLANALEPVALAPTGSESSSQPALAVAALPPEGASFAAHPEGTSFGASPKGASFATPSLLEPAATPGNPDYLFSTIPPAPPGNWDLLLGALLTGGFIARRRLRAD